LRLHYLPIVADYIWIIGSFGDESSFTLLFDTFFASLGIRVDLLLQLQILLFQLFDLIQRFFQLILKFQVLIFQKGHLQRKHQI